MPDEYESTSTPEDRALFRRTLIRVMTVQVVSLTLLWLLQRQYAA